MLGTALSLDDDSPSTRSLGVRPPSAMIGRMGCPDAIKRLIERFDHQLDQVRSPSYNEAQLRIDFVRRLVGTGGSASRTIDDRAGTGEIGTLR